MKYRTLQAEPVQKWPFTSVYRNASLLPVLREKTDHPALGQRGEAMHVDHAPADTVVRRAGATIPSFTAALNDDGDRDSTDRVGSGNSECAVSANGGNGHDAI